MLTKKCLPSANITYSKLGTKVSIIETLFRFFSGSFRFFYLFKAFDCLSHGFINPKVHVYGFEKVLGLNIDSNLNRETPTDNQCKKWPVRKSSLLTVCRRLQPLPYKEQLPPFYLFFSWTIDFWKHFLIIFHQWNMG